MAHGAPDWYIYRTDSITFPLGDMAELAVRLGAISTFDRRGDTIFQEDFTHGAGRWSSNLYGTGAAVTIDTDTFKTGPKCMKMVPGSDGGKAAYALTGLYYPRETYIGAEISFASQDAYSTFHLQLSAWDGTVLHECGVRYDRDNSKLELEPADGGTKEIATGIGFAAANHIWHTLKFVVDLATDQAIRAIFDNVEYDLTAWDMNTSASANPPQLTVYIKLVGPGAANPPVYVDDVILTQDEI